VKCGETQHNKEHTKNELSSVVLRAFTVESIVSKISLHTSLSRKPSEIPASIFIKRIAKSESRKNQKEKRGKNYGNNNDIKS
jgi:hypothetical protein